MFSFLWQADFFFISAKIKRDLRLQLNPKYELEKQTENNDICAKT